METEIVPTNWTEAKFTPIMRGSTNQSLNYWPVSFISVVCKLLNSITVDRIADYLEENNLHCNSQHGFRRRRSCLTNLLVFFHKVFTEHELRKEKDVIY